MSRRCNIMATKRSAFSSFFLSLVLLLHHWNIVCNGNHHNYSIRRHPVAGIFGLNGDRSDNAIRHRPPPPPPPSRPSTSSTTNRGGTTFVRPTPGQNSQKPPPPPPLPRTTSTDEKVEYTQEDEERQSDESIYGGNKTLSINENDDDRDEISTVLQDSQDRDYQDENQQQQRHQPPQRPPPPLPRWTNDTPNGYSTQSPTQAAQGWMGSSTSSYPQNEWQNQQQYYDYSNTQYEGDDSTSTYIYLQEELNESLERESSLISQLDNLTSAVIVMEQREELHTRQLDVLTERVMEVESQAANDRNLLVEYEANYTTLQTTIKELQQQLEEYQTRCNELIKQRHDDQEKINELKQIIKEKQKQAEDIAIAMEQLRMVEKRRQTDYSNTGRRSNKSTGLFGWILGLFGMNGAEDDQYDDDIREESYEMAKSTLLRALQSERANVDELEAMVTSLQQNNSAISEMVESRDMIIDELNSRVGVFEEDKVVLKAALRQLQKEMKEEAPKTQNLLDDLAGAEQEIDRLKTEIHSIIETHQEELSALQLTISEKQKTITDTESNLTAIGTYVDKLEQRLTSVAVTRRDMEERERKCNDIEKLAAETEIKRKALQTEIDEYKKEQDELKQLLEELATERTNLQKENRKLYTEREFRIGEQEQLESKYKSLEAQSKSMSEQLEEWKEKCERLMPELEASRDSQNILKEKAQVLDEMQERFEKVQEQNSMLLKQKEQMEEELNSISEEKERLEVVLSNVTKAPVEEEKKLEIDLGKGDDGDDNENEDGSTENSNVEESLKKPPQSQDYLLPRQPIRKPPSPPKTSDRKIPLRNLRKKLSKATGLHGLLTPSTKMLQRVGAPPRPPPRMPPGLKSDQQGEKPNDDPRKSLRPPPPLPNIEDKRTR